MERRLRLSVQMILIFFIAGTILFSSCSTTKINGRIVTIERGWVNWKIPFNQGTPDEKVAVTLGELDKYIFDYIKEKDPHHDTILAVSIHHNIIYGTANIGPVIGLSVDIRSIGGGKVRVTPPPPPRDELFINRDIMNPIINLRDFPGRDPINF